MLRHHVRLANVTVMSFESVTFVHVHRRPEIAIEMKVVPTADGCIDRELNFATSRAVRSWEALVGFITVIDPFDNQFTQGERRCHRGIGV